MFTNPLQALLVVADPHPKVLFRTELFLRTWKKSVGSTARCAQQLRMCDWACVTFKTGLLRTIVAKMLVQLIVDWRKRQIRSIHSNQNQNICHRCCKSTIRSEGSSPQGTIQSNDETENNQNRKAKKLFLLIAGGLMPIKLPVLDTILLTGRYSLCKRRSTVLPMDVSTLYLWISAASWYVHKISHRGCCAWLILGLKGMKKRSSGCSHSKSDSHESGELEEAELTDHCFSSGVDLFFLPCLIHIPRI